ncbi:hypothetical protein BY458DRAFT_520407 [Sporodiniella umbellata]|nr:hypothetical protein BY458DRAFT_520407 [Sporodiniella umbellata]
MTSISEPTTTKKMDQDVFSQLYQSLNPQDTTMFDEWLKQDFFSPECSVNSSPEIATPFDQFLNSPFPGKDEFPQCTFGDNPVDLDVSAILDSPPQVYQATPATTAAPPSLPAAATSSTASEMINLFADIGNSLPAALAALASVASPVSPVMVDTKQEHAAFDLAKQEKSPAATSASTPIFSATPRPSKKRAFADDPIDEAALKRQKNTDAARRSRLRKVQKMDCLEQKVADLEKLNASLLMRVAVLDSEKTNLKAKEASYENRIKVLESQLAEAHKALSSR